VITGPVYASRMAATENWAFPASLQPKAEEVGFDLGAALDAVVMLKTEVPEEAFTAGILGTERIGNGVVIRDDGLVLTIGYLITEAQSIWITTNRGTVVAGHALAYDQVTGFGLVLPLGALGVRALPRGRAADCVVGDSVYMLGSGGREHALKASVFAKREFAGYWEYVLDEAVFTSPAHPQWGGAALVGSNGKLLGIGSLLVQEAHEGRQVQGNMVVPIELLEPIFDDLVTRGRANRPPRAWLGLYVQEAGGRLVVGGLATGGPADRAGIKLGDTVLEVAGAPAVGLADFFRKVWELGPAGSEVPLTLSRRETRIEVRAKSGDRGDYLLKPRLH
jgi:S1-C subfamily serine protease